MARLYYGSRPELTEREHEIAELAARGLLTKEIAGELWITEHTVKFHLHRVYRKLDVRNRAQLAARWFGRGSYADRSSV